MTNTTCPFGEPECTDPTHAKLATMLETDRLCRVCGVAKWNHTPDGVGSCYGWR